jgi:hypothetical protein
MQTSHPSRGIVGNLPQGEEGYYGHENAEDQ